MPEVSVIIHGHFYQPPRESPWTGSIERQESASPYHDWNQRITAECYTPNTRSRVLDGRGRVLDVVNNFEHLSFNFGPTLIGYLDEHHPQTYRRILEGDHRSLERRGFGNALAQAYNHMILPLASPRDRWTQIQWGIADFRSRFHRDPAGIWLPETAANLETLTDLARAGLQFVLLAPSQADAIRPVGTEDWQDVSRGGMLTHRPYVCRTDSGDVQVLFYHAGLSTAVAFEHLLRNAGTFADRIAATAAEGPADEERLVFVCSDGESYGHHEPMGDMCFAYLATRELPARGMKLTNPAAYLDEHPPEWEVRLKPGMDGKGTAWSCAHGVGRWWTGCGCTTGGPPDWNQDWRTPLRNAFDRLRQRIDPQFERFGRKLLKDPWKARDAYIQVVLGKPLGLARSFFDTHARGVLDDEQRGQVYRLMEMQRHAMLMYTSCGWFFSDLAGLEAMQNLKYACRAAQLGMLLAGEPVDAEMQSELARAKSNLPEMGSALDLVRRFVRPAMLSPEKVAAHRAVLALVEPLEPTERLYQFRIQVHQQSAQRKSRAGGFDAYSCRLTVLADRTREGGTFDAAAVAGSNLRLLAFARPFSENGPPLDPADLLATVERDGFDAASRSFHEGFGTCFGLGDMLPSLRLRAVAVLLRPLLDELARTFEEIFVRNEGLLRALAPLGIALPRELTGPTSYAGTHRFDQLVERDLEEAHLDRATELARLLQSLDVPLDRTRASRLVGERLQAMLEQILVHPDAEEIGRFIRLLSCARAIRLELDEATLQDEVALSLEGLLVGLLDPQRPGGRAGDCARAVLDLAAMLNLNIDRAQELLKR